MRANCPMFCPRDNVHKQVSGHQTESLEESQADLRDSPPWDQRTVSTSQFSLPI